MKLVFELSVPPSINRTYKTNASGRFYKAPAAKDWLDEARWSIVSQVKRPLIREAVKVDLVFHYDRDRDIDNGIKAIYDALSTTVIEDDRQIYQASQRKVSGAAKPKVEVSVETLYDPSIG